MHCSALLHQKSYPAVWFNWPSGIPGCPLCWRDWHGRLATDHFFLPLLLKGFQKMGADLAHPPLESADL